MITIREAAEELISIGTGLSSAHPVGSKIADLGKLIIRELDEAPLQIEMGLPYRLVDEVWEHQ